jgi:hypothetical protein
MILKYFLNILGQSLARASLLLGAILNARMSWLDKLDLILEPNIQRYDLRERNAHAWRTSNTSRT